MRGSQPFQCEDLSLQSRSRHDPARIAGCKAKAFDAFPLLDAGTTHVGIRAGGIAKNRDGAHVEAAFCARRGRQRAGNKKSAVSLIHLSSFCLVARIVSRKRAFCRETDLHEPNLLFSTHVALFWHE